MATHVARWRSIYNARIQSNTHIASIRHYRARYQVKTKVRMMPMHKYLREQRKRGKIIAESLRTDFKAAQESHSNSQLLSISNSYSINQDKQQNIPLISERFFQRYFLVQFNTCDNTSQLKDALQSLKQKIVKQSENESNEDTNLREFEQNVLRLGYHSCIARCSFSNTNQINDGCIDTDAMRTFFDECKAIDLINHETYHLMLNGYINDYNANANEDKYHKIQDIFNEFAAFLNETDPERPRNIISECAYTQEYISAQNRKYSEIISDYLMFLCHRNTKNDLIGAVELFYHMMEKRFMVPNNETLLEFMRLVGNESNDSAEIARIFRMVASYRVNSPPIEFYNRYCAMLSEFGDIDECIKVLRLCVFKKYWNYMAIADAPLPNLETFEWTFKALGKAIENNRLTQDVGARKAEFVLQQMKELKMGTTHDIYVLLYETLGVAWWEALPWHLRLLNRP